MNVVIIGCGLIGQKRAKNLAGHKLIAVADIDAGRAKSLASTYPGCQALSDWHQAAAFPGADIVIIATTHNMLPIIGLEAIKASKHLLLEKPAARNRKELLPVAKLAAKKKKVVKVGFNHRFHPGILKAKELLAQGKAGDLMFIRANYGHGGRIGYDKEWRAERKISGGGEMIDQGMHLIDLARMFMGDFKEASGYVPTFFWDMKVEDNAFMLLKTKKGQAAWLHATWTEWKNLFSFEIYGRYAKLHMQGLGGSYGPERLTYYQMKPEMGPPDAQTFEFPPEDRSWTLEFEDFIRAIRSGERPNGDIQDALAALALSDSIYKRNKK